MKANYNIINYLNKDWSNHLKGIAISLILLGHLGIIRHAGAYGVAIFLIISGFGLTQSYIKSGLDGFFNKRVSKVLMPYFIVTSIWVIIDAFIRVNHSITSTILALMGINLTGQFDKTMWYITFILIWYLIFYITFKFIKSNTIRVSILFLVSIILYKYIRIFPSAVGAELYAFEFPIGVFISLCYKNLMNIREKRLIKYQIFLSVISTSIFFILIKYFNTMESYLLESLFFAIATISLFGILSMYSIKFKLLNFMGSISFEIYLFEGMFINNYNFIFNLSLNIWIQRLIFFVLVICLSLLLQKFIRIIKEISKPKKDDVVV